MLAAAQQGKLKNIPPLLEFIEGYFSDFQQASQVPCKDAEASGAC